MKNSVESKFSFSLESRRPEYHPSLLVTLVESKGVVGSSDFIIRHDYLNFLSNQETRIELCSEMQLLQTKIKKIEIQPNIAWPVNSAVTSHKWYAFRDSTGRFYAFLFVARITDKVLIKFYEKLRNAVSRSSQNADRLQKKVEDMVFKFNDYTYKESISEYLKNSNFECSEISSKKETCQTNIQQTIRMDGGCLQEQPKVVPQRKAEIGKEVDFYLREQRLFQIKLIFSFALSASVLLFVLDLFFKLHKKYQ